MSESTNAQSRVIAILNQKGGVGKTTTTLNLGAALAEAGKRVLMIDMDPQANLTRGIGVELTDGALSTCDILTDINTDINRVIQATKWNNLDIAPSHPDLAGAEVMMINEINREGRLVRSLNNVNLQYDYVLIDCLPSLGIITINAMNAAKELFIPMQAHPFALEGLSKIFDVYDVIQSQMNPELKVTGVLVTMFDTRTNVSNQVVDILRTNPLTVNALFNTIVRQNIKIAESQAVGEPVIHFDKTCHGARAYRALAQEVLAMVPAARKQDAA